MYNTIEKIINAWDPVDLFPMAPKDEYKSEINKIINLYKMNKNISIDELAKEISIIFKTSFGEELIFKNNEREVAQQIIEQLF
ncbi:MULTISPECIES: DUF1871 family protein [unclassified Enterococcus]|uniref:DUF1871 family protein n=1 Tax=unclassified Enterococcus TaxID=2608891 RepID=UPI001551EFDD|nr:MULTISPECIES: DUF1871 family protein [unclassified Enterococcus]MBS7576945.1 DUF1871 family protein [Enterococcus sp. MMGLQ5-2]MBS7584352.1 DUF1871 family protein [Enterococcus sp. MMGLQ5-1]NPD12207.1 DUF1871 family protein [Enterococcus sp. MMGLQ5-1]NPD36779.1 DUF1871 family protein [Enterococcus sp. MMGLQ5-2]